MALVVVACVAFIDDVVSDDVYGGRRCSLTAVSFDFDGVQAPGDGGLMRVF